MIPRDLNAMNPNHPSAMIPEQNPAMDPSANFVATETSTPTPLESVDILLPARLWVDQALLVELLQECASRGVVSWRVLMGVSASMPSSVQQLGEAVKARLQAAGAVVRIADVGNASIANQFVSIVDSRWAHGYLASESGAVISREPEVVWRISQSWRELWKAGRTHSDPDVSSLLSAFEDAEREVKSVVGRSSEAGSAPPVTPSDSASQVGRSHPATPARNDGPKFPPPSIPPPKEAPESDGHGVGAGFGEVRTGAELRGEDRELGQRVRHGEVNGDPSERASGGLPSDPAG